jgi:hypothetical protein
MEPPVAAAPPLLSTDPSEAALEQPAIRTEATTANRMARARLEELEWKRMNLRPYPSTDWRGVEL